jgi:flagellar basal-body rod protein FlgC
MPTLTDALAASRSALTAERVRIEAAVSNLANAESTSGYRRRDVVLATETGDTFDAALGRTGAVGVRVTAVTEDQTPSRQVYEPSHPDADAEGFISLPNVNPSEEMVDMLGAARAYQANLTAVSLIRDMVQRALEIGR